MKLDEVRDAVTQVLQAHLAPSILTKVLVFQETDSDGEPILRLQAVIDHAGPELGADKIFFATGVVRNALADRGETRFPLLTFPSSDEMPEVAA